MVAKVDFSRNISVLGMVNRPFKVQRFSIEHMNYEFLSIGGCGVDPCRRFINQDIFTVIDPLKTNGFSHAKLRRKIPT
jgi:hypothetical protein